MEEHEVIDIWRRVQQIRKQISIVREKKAMWWDVKQDLVVSGAVFASLVPSAGVQISGLY